MATQYEKNFFGRALISKEDFGEKPTRSPDRRSTSKKRMRSEKPKDEGVEGGDKVGRQFSLPFQDKKNCQEISGKEAEGSKIVESFDYEDSWSSDEGEGISVEELKDTKGYKLFMKALQAHAKNSAKSV